jgi:YidC/Oxa1 family membrane protein insertase
LYLSVSTQGGFISEAQLKGLNDFKGAPIYLIKDGNEHFDLTFFNRANQKIQTRQLYFTPSLSTQDNAQVLSMKMVVSETQFIEYRYTLPNDGYMLDFSIVSQGFSALTNGDKEVALDWNLKGFRQAKSVIYENRYTELKYQYEGDKIGYLSASQSASQL